MLGGLLILCGVLISEEKGSAESMAVAPDHAGVPQPCRGAQRGVPADLWQAVTLWTVFASNFAAGWNSGSSLGRNEQV